MAGDSARGEMVERSQHDHPHSRQVDSLSDQQGRRRKIHKPVKRRRNDVGNHLLNSAAQRSNRLPCWLPTLARLHELLEESPQSSGSDLAGAPGDAVSTCTTAQDQTLARTAFLPRLLHNRHD